MTIEDPNSARHAERTEALRVVFQVWQQGQNEQALNDLHARLKNNPDESPLLVLALWLAMQHGSAGWILGIDFAKLAIDRGKPWLARTFTNGLIGNIQGLPELFPKIIELLPEISPFNAATDYASAAWQLMAQGRFEEAAQILEISASELPVGESGLTHLNEVLSRTRELSGHLEARANGATAMINKVSSELETKAKQAELLIDSISAQTIDSRFVADAQQNKEQSDRAYKWGLIVLTIASAMAVLPLALYYLKVGQNYNAVQVLGVHASATLALGAVSGVLLARARHRDRARQRAADLSTAMGTIIVYSNQIQSADERQRFMQTMGQLVLVAHLQADQSGSDQATVTFASLMNALRTPAQ